VFKNETVSRDTTMMTTILIRRFAILCLGFALFAVGFWLIVDSHERPARIGQFNFTATCTLVQDIKCRTRT